jgi:hypothetical protein
MPLGEIKLSELPVVNSSGSIVGDSGAFFGRKAPQVQSLFVNSDTRLPQVVFFAPRYAFVSGGCTFGLFAPIAPVLAGSALAQVAASVVKPGSVNMVGFTPDRYFSYKPVHLNILGLGLKACSPNRVPSTPVSAGRPEIRGHGSEVFLVNKRELALSERNPSGPINSWGRRLGSRVPRRTPASGCVPAQQGGSSNREQAPIPTTRAPNPPTSSRALLRCGINHTKLSKASGGKVLSSSSHAVFLSPFMP